MTDEEKKAAAEEAARKKAEEEAAEEAARKAKEDDDDDDDKSKDKPSDKEAELLKDMMKWKQKAKENEEAAAAIRKEADEKLKVFEGIDPAAARDALKAAKDAERKSLESKGQYDRVLEQVNKDHADELAKVAAAVKERDDALAARDKTINELTVGNNFGNSKFINEKLVLSPAKAKQLYDAHFDVEDGKVVGYDKPRGSAERTPLVGTGGKPLEFEAAIEKIVSADPDFERIKKSTLKPGAESDTDAKGKPKIEKGEELSGVERIRAALAGKK
mgnify:CR=1 FL=1